MMVVQSMADMFECSNNLAPLGSARGALWSAQTVRRAKPRREIQCIYTHPSAPLGVQPSASLGVQCSALNGVPLGSARGATLGFARGATLGSAQTVRRAKPRREIQCRYLHPSASLGVHSASLGVHSALLGVHSALLGVQSKRNSHCIGKCSFYPNIFTHSPTCVHMKSASGTSV